MHVPKELNLKFQITQSRKLKHKNKEKMILSHTPSLESSVTMVSRDFRDVVKEKIKNNLESQRRFSEKKRVVLLGGLLLLTILSASYSFQGAGESSFVFSLTNLNMMQLVSSRVSHSMALGSVARVLLYVLNLGYSPGATDLDRQSAKSASDYLSIINKQHCNDTLNFLTSYPENLDRSSVNIINSLLDPKEFKTIALGNSTMSFIDSQREFLIKCTESAAIIPVMYEFSELVMSNHAILINISLTLNSTISNNLDSSFHRFEGRQFVLHLSMLIK